MKFMIKLLKEEPLLKLEGIEEVVSYVEEEV